MGRFVKSFAVLAASALIGIMGFTSLAGAVPANDDFGNATLVTANAGCSVGTNLDATSELGEQGVGSFDTSSVWYSWTAPSSGNVTFRVYLRTMADSLLGVYTGSQVDSLTLVVSNDDYNIHASRVTFSASSGTTYQIRVSAWIAGQEGTYALDWGGGCLSPGNDAFESATVISGVTGTLSSQSNEAATLQSGELSSPAHAQCTDNYCGTTADLGGPSVWYSWTAPAAIEGFELCVRPGPGGDFSPIIGAYTGSLGNLTEVAWSTQSSSDCAAVLAFDAQNGISYTIGVGGSRGSTGFFDLVWPDVSPPTAQIAVGASQPNITSTSPVIFDVTFSKAVTGFTAGDVDLTGSTTGTGTVTISDSGDQIHYAVEVEVTTDGDVVASVPAAVASDTRGKGNLASGSATINVDRTAPAIGFLTLKVKGPDVQAVFAATDANALSYQCSVDSGGYFTCQSGDTYLSTPGSHTFDLRAIDALGNSATTSGSFIIKSRKVKG